MEFAGYVLDRSLGRGGMSEVYVAHRPGSADYEALKILDPTATDSLRRKFTSEAKLGARLSHPNIVAVHEFGEESGRLWMSMYYVDGYSAARLVAPGQISLDVHRAARIVDQVAAALDYAHGEGVVHRDVKPSNVLIGAVDERVFLSDWGIARMLDEERPLVSDDGTVMASVGYAAPELLRGDGVSARTDVYALGATLVELLTGRTPFPLSTPYAIIDAQLDRTPPDVSARRPGLPKQLDAVVHRAMAKDPRDRFPSCGDLAAATARAVEFYAPAPPPRRWWPRR